MSDLALAIQTMDSREIAHLTNKDHGHVCRDIQEMLGRLSGLNQSSFGAVYKAGNGEERKCYKLPYRETMILVSGYSIELRARVVDRWMELERKDSMPSAPRGAELLALAVIEAQKMLDAKDAEIAVLAPKAAVADMIAGAEGLKTLSEVGKITNLGPRRIIDALLNSKVLYRQGRLILPKQEHIEAGRFVVKDHPYDVCGTVFVYSQTLVTGKGETWIAEKYGRRTAR